MTHRIRPGLIALLSSVLFASSGQTLAQPQFAPAKAVQPDAKTLVQIQAKTKELAAAIDALPSTTRLDVRADVEVYLKAAEWIVRHGEWFNKSSASQTLAVIETGLDRAKAARTNRTPWRDVRGKPIIRGYFSHVDRSVQPYSVTLPEGYPGKKSWRLDIVLHGRNGTLTEAGFIYSHENSKSAAKPDRVVLEPYGRGNNAYRWSGERDVFEAHANFVAGESDREGSPLDPAQLVVRGFSMGGAGTWHLGLHYPYEFAAMQPGAGFTTTHGYIGNLPAVLPEYQENCLTIYDAVDYAENARSIPVIAYSGGNDKQKLAADLVEKRVKELAPNAPFTHIIAPGLEHKQPPEWYAKCDAEIAKHLPRKEPQKIAFVTYTPRYNRVHWARIRSLERMYTRAELQGEWSKDGPVLTTTNIQSLDLSRGHFYQGKLSEAKSIVIDGQRLTWPADSTGASALTAYLEDRNGTWSASDTPDGSPKLRKRAGLQGPIDDAFMSRFLVVPASGGAFAKANYERMLAEWDKFLRGTLTPRSAETIGEKTSENLILFGDPTTNPVIAKILPKLPITWTKEKLVVNGIEYDAKTHVPVLIYPNPLHPDSYVVINSGHTFHAADFQGTNALLYPKLGDWAVLKPAPTQKDPAAAEVVAAGLFDENWQFAKPVALKSFTAPGSKLEKLWSEGEFTEGPAPGPDGSIYFSDIGNRIMKFDPKTKSTTAFRDPGGRTNGLKFDTKGRLIACEGANTGGGRRISITGKDGEVKSLADRYMGKIFNSPNDLTISAQGSIYFTDPRYVGDDPRELDQESVYRIDPKGKLTRVITDVKKPNGIAISPDGVTLYLAENNSDLKVGPRQLLAYPLKPDGSVGKKTILYDFGTDRGIDGMAITREGIIAATAGKGPTAGIHFFMPSGKKIGFLPTPETPTNCCFGGPGSKTLYITAGRSLYRVDLTLAGK